jgi:hypothetical protein
MLTKAVGSGDGGSRIVEALQLAPQQRDLRLLIRINRGGAVRVRGRWGRRLRLSQRVCLENSHFSRLNSSKGQVRAGVRNGAGRLGSPLSASSLSHDRR